MNLRWYMIRILLGREWLRFYKNPSAIMLLGLLTAISLLLATSSPKAGSKDRDAKQTTCWVVYWEKSPWVRQLEEDVPENLSIHIVHANRIPRRGGRLQYPPGDYAIELRPPSNQRGSDVRPAVFYRFSGTNPNTLFPYTQWFWRATAEHFGQLPPFVEHYEPIGNVGTQDVLAGLASSSVADLVSVELIATILLFFVQFFACCHLFVSFASQDRERGTLLALALSPATTTELLVARFLFHLAISMAVSGVVVGILRPAALTQPLLWTVVLLASVGLMSVATVIASLAHSQTTAGLLTLCYMLATGVVFYLATKFSGFAWVKQAMIEHYSLPLVYMAMKQHVGFRAAPALLMLTLLTAGWVAVAASLFRSRGWR